jgi:tRNA(fMet)-specific endonuclease VapC
MLDTNVLIGCLRRKNSLSDIVEQHGKGHDLVVSSISYGELMVGLMTNDTPRRRSALNKVLAPMTILDFNQNAAKVFGKIKVDLKANPIGAYDLQIAAHAISEGYTLVTHNTKEFARVEGLNIVDWEDQ